METGIFHIKGPNSSLVVDLFKETIKKEARATYSSSYDNINMFFVDIYYKRIGYFLTVVVFNLADKDRPEINIVSGGGSEGLLGMMWRLDDSSNRRMVQILQDICGSNKWQLFDSDGNEITKAINPEKLRQLEKDADEYEEMSIKYNEMIESGMEESAEKLYEEWCKNHPDDNDG